MRMTFGGVVAALVMGACGSGADEVDAGMRGDGAARDAGSTDAGDPAPDPGAVAFVPADLPADGPLRVWGYAVAKLGDGRAVLFGGTNANETTGTTFSEAWLYDMRGGAIAVTPIEADGPAPRYCACTAWDPVRERLILMGGRQLESPLSVPAETWELDVAGATWTQAAVPESPQSIIGCMMAFSEASGATYLFGGAGAAGPSDVIYRYDPAAPAWVALDATGPSARYDGILEPVAGGAELLLFGGSYSAMGAAFYSDVWRFDTASESWTEVVIDGDVPPGRRVPWAVLTADERTLYVAMGFDGRMETIGDFWFLDLDAPAWHELALPAALRARAFSMALPGTGDALGTMLSGYDGAGPIAEAWQLVPEPR